MINEVSNLMLFLNDYCNFSCKYCYIDSKTKGKKLTYDVIEKFLSFFSKYAKPGIKIELTGGEPGLHKDLTKILNLIDDLFIFPKTFLLTNGSFPQNNLDELLKTSAKFIITFEGLPKFQDFERSFSNGEKSSEKVLENMKKIIEHDPNKLFVRINLSKLKIGKEKEIFNFFEKLGVKNVFFSIVAPKGRGKTYENTDVKKSSDAFVEFNKYFEKGNFNIVSSKLIEEVNNWPSCGGSNQLYSLTIDKKIIPCNVIISSETMDKRLEPMIIGEVETGVKIFEDKLKNYIKFSKEKSENCECCSVKLFCSGCPMNRLLEGDWKTFCNSTKIRLKPFLDKKV